VRSISNAYANNIDCERTCVARSSHSRAIDQISDFAAEHPSRAPCVLMNTEPCRQAADAKAAPVDLAQKSAPPSSSSFPGGPNHSMGPRATTAEGKIVSIRQATARGRVFRFE
jgi:hypothetical protein